jgi:hypothetical protein
MRISAIYSRAEFFGRFAIPAENFMVARKKCVRVTDSGGAP